MTEQERVEAVEKIVNRTRGFERRLYERIGKSLAETKKISVEDAQALRNLYSITGDMEAITKDLAETLNISVAEMTQLYDTAMADEVSEAKALYDFKNLPYIPYKENVFAQGLVRNWAVQTAGEMVNISNTKALGFAKYDLNGKLIGTTPLNESWQQAIDRVVFSVAQGTDIRTEMKNIIEELGGSGIRVTYPSGRSVRLDSVLRQNILYGAKQAINGYNEEVASEIGSDIFYVTHSYTCRESHRFMDCGQFSLGKSFTDSRGQYYPAGYDALIALEDYGCNHDKRYGISGVSENPISSDEKERLQSKLFESVEYNGITKTRSEWIQYQRGIERAKREVLDKYRLAKSANETDRAREYNKQIKTLNAKYEDLCDRVGLVPAPERMRKMY